jgi:hypothetical protein
VIGTGLNGTGILNWASNANIIEPAKARMILKAIDFGKIDGIDITSIVRPGIILTVSFGCPEFINPNI